METFIFPLNTVLFPDGKLMLRIFEQRYLEMTKQCLRDDLPFGVCLIREGREVGTPAVPEGVGCLAKIVQWDMPHPGLFTLEARGGTRFRILHHEVTPIGLISADVEQWDEDPPAAVSATCAQLMKTLIESVGAEHFPSPARLEDAAWVGYRLAEVLPLPQRTRQALLELRDAAERLKRIESLLPGLAQQE